MFAVRLIVLMFLVPYSWSMGHIPASELNEFGKFISLSFFIVAPALYLLPTFEAWLRSHPNLPSVALINILLGWSLIGWVVAAVWALKKPEIVIAPATLDPSKSYRECPYCAETILAKAKVCKHCHKDVEPLAANEYMSGKDIEALARGKRG
jgi:hypothetical protein